MHLSGERNGDWCPGERSECTCAEVTVGDPRRGDSLRYTGCIYMTAAATQTLLTYLTVRVIRKHSGFQIASRAATGRGGEPVSARIRTCALALASTKERGEGDLGGGTTSLSLPSLLRMQNP